MESLKDKAHIKHGIVGAFSFEYAHASDFEKIKGQLNDKYYTHKDVKEAVLEMRKEIRMIESAIERNKLLKIHTEIFGDFMEDEK